MRAADWKLHERCVKRRKIGAMRMSTDWLRNAVVSIASISAIIAMVECIGEESGFQGGLRLVCGTYAAFTVIRMGIDFVQALF